MIGTKEPGSDLGDSYPKNRDQIWVIPTRKLLQTNFEIKHIEDKDR